MNISDKFSYFMEGNNGKGVLLIHGLTGIPAEMKLVARGLNRAGYSIYAPLLAGHGMSKKELVKTNWQDWLGSVLEAAAALGDKVESVYTAGICVGGKLGMMAANRMPEVIRATAIYSPCFRYDGWNVPFYYPILSYNISWLSRVPFMDRLSFRETSAIGIKDDRLRKMMENMSTEGVIENFPGKGLVEMHRLGKALKKELPHMKTPTLILHAEEDDLSNPRNARAIAKRIAAPHQLHWIKDSYHMLHVDAQHRLVTELTADFFGKEQRHYADA